MGTVRKRRETPRKGDLREQAILDTAEVLLERESVEPMTVESIARGAGISRASVYFYFGSKQEILTALVARTVAALVEDARGASAAVGSAPRDVVRAAVRTVEAMWREHGRVMRAAVDFSSAIPGIGVLWDDAVAACAQVMTPVLARAGVPEGDGPADAAALAHALCWMTERTFYRASRDERDLSAAGETCVEIWCRALPAP